MKRLRIKTELETLHDEEVSEEIYAERLQAYKTQVELYALQGIVCDVVEGDDPLLVEEELPE